MARYRVGLETRQRILDAARSLLSEEGVDAITLKAITDRAGVGAGSFYNLFDSKEQAVFEIVREAIQAVDPDPVGEEETVEALVDAYVSFVTDGSDVARIYLQLAVGRGLTDDRIASRILRSHRARVQRFAAAIARDQPQLDPVAAERHAEGIVASLTGLAITTLFDPTFDFHTHAHALRRGLA